MTPAVLLLLATAILLTLGGLIAGLIWWVQRPAAVPRVSDDPLPLFSNTRGAIWRDRPVPLHATTDDADGRRPHAERVGYGERGTEDVAMAPGVEVATEAHAGELPYAYSPGVPVMEGDIVRFAQPSDRSLQWLPGALQILNGPDVGRTIRFVHVPTAMDDVITFGRSTGPAYRHVQLRDGLVNRRHAQLLHEHGQWLLINLSEERPVLRNDEPLPVGEAQVLQNGDRVTMGATLFQFRG